ncbi:hypothetical protein Tco_1168487, partial [Tanacetum coccineum]
EQNIPHTKDVEGPPNQESTKGIQEHVVQNEQINDQSTKETSGNNTETLVPITEILVPEAPQSQKMQHVSTKKECLQEVWLPSLQLPHLVNVDFLSKIEPKKVYEALKHPRWVDALQEELNQFYRNKVWTLVPNGCSGTKRINIELSLRTKQDWLHKVIVRKKELTMMKPLHQWQEWKPSGSFLPLLNT